LGSIKAENTLTSWINVKGRDQWQVLVNTIVNIRAA